MRIFDIHSNILQRKNQVLYKETTRFFRLKQKNRNANITKNTINLLLIATKRKQRIDNYDSEMVLSHYRKRNEIQIA